MRHHMTGRGRCETRINPPSILLYNFDVNGDHLKPEHRAFLATRVVPALRKGGSVSIVGLTSRTGSFGHNKILSQKRADRTLGFLRHEVRTGFSATPTVGIGELLAAAQGNANNFEHPRFRSVILFVSERAEPPPPPAVVDVTPDNLVLEELLPDTDVLDLISKGNDALIGILGFGELVPLEAVAVLAGKLGLAATVLSSLAQMPLIWKGTRDQNLLNGRMEGYWDAVQDMANAFSSSGLSNVPDRLLPRLPRPEPHPFTQADQSLNQREWMDGRREGCLIAYEFFSAMDRSPPLTKGVQMIGRRQLFRLRRKFGSEGLREWLKSQFDQRLLSKGYGRWPVMRDKAILW
jgi:hypothetical protein